MNDQQRGVAAWHWYPAAGSLLRVSTSTVADLALQSGCVVVLQQVAAAMDQAELHNLSG